MGYEKGLVLYERLLNLIEMLKLSQNLESEILGMFKNNNSLTTTEIESYTIQIKQYTQERRDNMKLLFEIIKIFDETDEELYDTYSSDVQLIILREKQMEDTKKTIKELSEERMNMERKSDITTYYLKYYRAWSEYMGMFFLVALINITIMYGSYIGYVPEIIPVVLLACSCIYLYILSVDLHRRDKNVFDEYEWSFDPNNVKLHEYHDTDAENVKPLTSEEINNLTAEKCNATIAASIQESGGTIQCQSGKVYDEKLFKCVIKPKEEGPVEAFTAMSDCKTVHME